MMKFSEFLTLPRKWSPENSLDRYVYRGELHVVEDGAKLMKVVKFCNFNGIMLFLHTCRPRLLSLYKHHDLGSFSGAEKQEFDTFHNFNEISG